MSEEVSIGWCRPFSDADLLARLGFDHVELPLADQLIESDTAAFNAHISRLRASPLPIRSFNYFYPRDIRIVGPDITRRDRLDRYHARVAELMNRVGAKIAVLGSAWARNVPEGYARDRAEADFVAALDAIGKRLSGTGATVVIEPLYRQESNLINNVAEGAIFAGQVNRPEIRVLADFFHMDEEHEALTTLIDNRAWLAHVHLADTGRRNPGSGSYPYADFFACLRQAGYRGAMSAECVVENAETEMAHSLKFLRRQWSQSKSEDET